MQAFDDDWSEFMSDSSGSDNKPKQTEVKQESATSHQALVVETVEADWFDEDGTNSFGDDSNQNQHIIDEDLLIDDPVESASAILEDDQSQEEMARQLFGDSDEVTTNQLDNDFLADDEPLIQDNVNSVESNWEDDEPEQVNQSDDLENDVIIDSEESYEFEHEPIAPKIEKKSFKDRFGSFFKKKEGASFSESTEKKQSKISSFFNKKEDVSSVLFVVNDIYRWYVFDRRTNELTPTNDPVITLNVYVWHDKIESLESKLAEHKIKKSLLRDNGIKVDKLKKESGKWYYLSNDFVKEMQMMGFSKLYSLQMMMDGIATDSAMEAPNVIYCMTSGVFAARVCNIEGKYFNQALFNAEESSVKAIFTHLLTTHKIDASNKHINLCDFKNIIVRTDKTAYWLLEDRIVGLPILPINSILIASIGLTTFYLMGLFAQSALIKESHKEKMNEMTINYESNQLDFEITLFEKRRHIAYSLSIDIEDIAEKASIIYEPGVKIGAIADHTGKTEYSLWWTNSVTPLVSFIDNKLPEGCSEELKVSGNAETAYKKINCLSARNYVGRYVGE